MKFALGYDYSKMYAIAVRGLFDLRIRTRTIPETSNALNEPKLSEGV